MEHTASNQFNKFKLTGGIALSVKPGAPLYGVITSHPLFTRSIIMEHTELTKNKTERRVFLRTAGMAAVGLSSGQGISQVAADEQSQLDIELTKLDDEEKVELADFLKHFKNDGRILRASMKDFFLEMFSLIDYVRAAKEKYEKAGQDERNYRDSLTGQDKVNYFIEKMRDIHLCAYVPSFQREVLELVREGQTVPQEDDQRCYVIGKLNERFEGCSKAFRQNVIDEYLVTVLPALEAEQDEDDARQEACDGLLACISHKTTGEIVDLSEKIEKAGVV